MMVETEAQSIPQHTYMTLTNIMHNDNFCVTKIKYSMYNVQDYNILKNNLFAWLYALG